MADTTNIENIISEKTQSDYYANNANREDNFVIDNELTVTITLHEYRKLLTSEAEAKVKEAKSSENDEYRARKKVEEELEKVKCEVNSLRKESLYLRKKLGIDPYISIDMEDDKNA